MFLMTNVFLRYFYNLFFSANLLGELRDQRFKSDRELDEVTIRFSGDSGDGCSQLELYFQMHQH